MKLGDIVFVIEEEDGNENIVNKFGKIIDVYSYPDYCGVEFKEYIAGHDCGLKGKNGHCWNISVDNLRPVNKNSLIKTYLERREDSS